MGQCILNKENLAVGCGVRTAILRPSWYEHNHTNCTLPLETKTLMEFYGSSIGIFNGNDCKDALLQHLTGQGQGSGACQASATIVRQCVSVAHPSIFGCANP
ncbi:hypothetical protein E2C01_054355 [Portunus trituberculatus]|uniref:Uncharacterized protein n=1 Tax=Portunus trituberculatus TaxID=210409 RepID=A0A5B7GUS7_PORTR|nr:hypothetical protein [Portunus trituberculatus]